MLYFNVSYKLRSHIYIQRKAKFNTYTINFTHQLSQNALHFYFFFFFFYIHHQHFSHFGSTFSIYSLASNYLRRQADSMGPACLASWITSKTTSNFISKKKTHNNFFCGLKKNTNRLPQAPENRLQVSSSMLHIPSSVVGKSLHICNLKRKTHRLRNCRGRSFFCTSAKRWYVNNIIIY